MLKIMKIVKRYNKVLESIDGYLDCVDEEKAGENDEELVNAYMKIISCKFEIAETMHNAIIKIIERYRNKVGNPPEYMMKLWGAEHSDYMEKFSKLKYRYDMEKK